MTNEQLERIQKELMDSLNNEQKQKDEITNLKEIITSELMISQKAKAVINEREYNFIYAIKGNTIQMIIADSVKFKMLQEKYRPYTASAEIEQQYTLRECLASTVEAFIRHILDATIAEEL